MPKECPNGGCQPFVIMSTETRKEIAFLSDKVTDALENAATCITNMTEAQQKFSETYVKFQATLNDLNTSLLRQSDRMEEGKRRFGSIEDIIDDQKDKMGTMHDNITILKTQKIMSKTQQGSLTVFIAAIVAGIAEFFTRG